MDYADITTLYNSSCNTCGGFQNASTTSLFTDDEMENLIEGVETGLYTPDNLPEWYYVRVAEALYSAVEIGFGSTLLELEMGSVDYLLLEELQTNIYVFSAAKTYQQVREMSDLLVKYKDRPDLFKKEAQKIFEDYNNPKGANYLSAEYQTAKASARSAINWTKIEAKKDLFPLLEYQTQGDARVRPTHVELDGIVRPVDDKFWGSYYPPNGWRCFKGDTEILTPSGWVRIDKVGVGDVVIGGSGKAQNVDVIHVNRFDGMLQKTICKNGFVLSTKNHRILTFNGWVEAGNINVGDIVIQQFEGTVLDKIICTVNNIYTLFRYFIVANIINRKA